MSPSEILQRLRRFLLVLSSLLFVGTLLELWLVNHTEEFIQWVAFVLSGLGLLCVLVVFFRMVRGTVLILRISMLVVVLGSLFGIYQHVMNNFEFEREINPNASASELVPTALGGANPLLAPGILAVSALLALGATYKYSNVGNEKPERAIG